MIRSIAIATAIASVLVVACGGSDDVTVGKSDTSNQKLQTKADGSPTGDGTTCSWAGTTTYASVYGDTPAAPTPTYSVGDEFKSIDGCNTCSCATQGIMCTLLACGADAGPKACPALARICKDGSTATTGPDCAQTCPGEGTVVACTADAKKCPDGTYVGRGGPNCEFAPCGGGYVCPASVLKCPDGSYVGPSGPNCTFPECPTPGGSCTDLMLDAHTQLEAAGVAANSCKEDADCQAVPNSVSCYPGCSAFIAKASVSDYNAAKAKIEDSICTKFNAQKCQFAGVGCPAVVIVPRCVNNKCSQ